jgi:hypothetical protein
MIAWLKLLFSESPGVSETRVQCMLITITGCYVVFSGMNKTVPDYSGIATLACAIFSIAQGGKVWSKYAESSKGQPASIEVKSEK